MSYTPVRPFDDCSCASATSRSPSCTAATYEIDACSATLGSLRELHANANAESASVNVTPPCAIACPFTIACVIVSDARAKPGRASSSTIPSACDAWSRESIASAHARASASPVSAATLTRAACGFR